MQDKINKLENVNSHKDVEDVEDVEDKYLVAVSSEDITGVQRDVSTFELDEKYFNELYKGNDKRER